MAENIKWKKAAAALVTGPGDSKDPGAPPPVLPSDVQPLSITQLEAPAPARRGVPQPPRRETLAASVADAAAAQLLLDDDLPSDERPRPGDRVLLVGIVWGGTTLIEIEQIPTGGDLSVRRLFDLPALQTSGSRPSKNFNVVKHVGEDHVITLPSGAFAEVHRSRKVFTPEKLVVDGKARRVEAPFQGYALEIETDDRVVAQVAPQLTLIARYVRAARQRDKSLLQQIDVPFAATLLVSLFALGVLVISMARAPRPSAPPPVELARIPPRLTKYEPKLPELKPEAPKVKDLSGVKEGEKAQGPEGRIGTQEAKKKEADPSKKGRKVAELDKKESDRKKVLRLGLVAALSKMGATGGAASSVLGPGGLGSGINNALGGVKGGKGLGDAQGVGGMAARGTGRGGGGKALGIGGLGTKGGGSGAGGYGSIDLGGRGKDETVFVPGRTTVVGGLSRDVINRVIQRHYNEIKYCYEKQLTHDPGLYGKIAVLFVIDGTGHVGDALVQQTTMSSPPVESCIVDHVKRWAFPAPQGGGTVQVTYPYVFKSGGQ